MIHQLIEKIQSTKAPICVGLDPMLNYIPEHILKKSFGEFGETLEGAADAIWQFNKEIIDHTFDPVSYTHLTLPTKSRECRSRWSPYH